MISMISVISMISTVVSLDCIYSWSDISSALTTIALLFNNVYVYAAIILFGLLFCRAEIYVRTAILVIFTMIYNIYLKSLWQLPLPPPMQGWGFPSGHMHACVVFWGWLTYEYIFDSDYPKWLFASTLLLLAAAGVATVYAGYHYPIDVIGACGFGLLSIFLYAKLQALAFFAQRNDRLAVLMTLLAGIIMALLPAAQRQQNFLLIAMAVLIVITTMLVLLSIISRVILPRFRLFDQPLRRKGKYSIR